MRFDEQVNKNWHEHRTGKHMASGDIQREVRQQYQCNPLGDA